MNEYCRLKIIDACYKNKFCDWRLAHTLKSLSTWNRIYFVCVKKCHNKNRFRTAAAAAEAAPALASVANMTLYKNECTVEFGWCGVCQEYVIFWLELMSLCVCCFFIVSVLLFCISEILFRFQHFLAVQLVFCFSFASIWSAFWMPYLQQCHWQSSYSSESFLYHPTNAKSRNIWIKCANFCTCPFRNSEMIDSSVR